MDDKIERAHEDMKRRSKERKAFQESRRTLEKQIARLLAESQVTCAELPEILDNVRYWLVVQATD